MLLTIKRRTTKIETKPRARNITARKIRAGMLALLVGALLPPMVINAQAYELPDGMPDFFTAAITFAGPGSSVSDLDSVSADSLNNGRNKENEDDTTAPSVERENKEELLASG